MPTLPRAKVRDLAVVAAVTLLGALLCAIDLTHRSLWLDEGATLSIVSQHGAALWSAIAHDGGNMLVYYLLLHVIVGIFGDGLVALRLVSVIADGVTAGVVALLALRLFGSRAVAGVAGVLSAASVGLVFWGQDARGYALMVTLAALSFLALVAILQSDPHRPPPTGAVIGYVLATTAALYIGFDVVLLVPAQVLCAVLLRRRRRTLVGCLIVIAAFSVPLVVLAASRGSGQLFWVPPLSGHVIAVTLLTLISAGSPENFRTTVFGFIAVIPFTVVTIVAVVIAWRSRWGPGPAAFVIVPVLWLVVTAVIGLLAAAVGEPLELARISILLMPAVSLLVAWVLVGPRDGLAAVPGHLGGPDRSMLVGIGLSALVLVLRLAVLIPSYSQTPEPWNAAEAHVLTQAQSGDCIAFYPQDGRQPFGYYVQHTPGAAAHAPRPLLPVEPWSSTTPHVEQYDLPTGGQLPSLTRGCGRIWLVSSHQGQSDGTKTSRRNFAGYLAIQRELFSLYPHRTLNSYGYSSPVKVFLYRH